MAKIVKCSICGKEFETSRPNKKYCSFVCREAGTKLTRLNWDNRHAGYMTSYMKNYRQKNRKEA